MPRVDSPVRPDDVGVVVLAKRVDYASVTTIAPAAGDQARLQVDELGRLHVAIGPYDPISRIPVMMDFAHHQLHEGETYQYAFYGAVNNTSKDFRLLVPNVAATTRTPHLVLEYISDATSFLYLYEGPTWTSGGTEATTIYNRNRNSTNTPGMKIYAAGGTALTNNTTGTLLYTGWTIASARASVTSDRSLSEWDLKANTEYMVRITTGGQANCLLRMDWYEDLGV